MKKIKRILKSIFDFSKNKNDIQKLRTFKDDTFIVSYPKSGNTWVRFIIANLIYGEEEEINFHKAKQFIPDFEVHHQDIENLNRPRILKSHSLYNPSFGKVVYIVRDVRDVYISYFYYLKNKLPENKTISEFIREIDTKEGGWARHINSWIQNKSKNILIVKYENLLNNTFLEIKTIVEFMGLSFGNEKIRQAIAKSSFENMKKIEQTSGRPFLSEEAEKLSATFVRSGKKGEWKKKLNKADSQYLLNKHRLDLENLGYSLK
jgi:estrone sulfotransferase